MTWISLEPEVVVRDVPMPESESGWGMVYRNQQCACALINAVFIVMPLTNSHPRCSACDYNYRLCRFVANVTATGSYGKLN